MTHIEAIVLAAGSGNVASSVHGPIWSDGHIAIRGEFPGKDQPRLAEIWRDVESRAGEVEVAPKELQCRDDLHCYVRVLRGDGGLMSCLKEAFLRALCGAGISAYAVNGQDAPIAFRRAGELVAMAMPVRVGFGGWPTFDEVTNAKVFAPFACSGNGFYLQSEAEIRAEFRKELTEIQEELASAREKLSDAQEEVNELEKSELAIEARIRSYVSATPVNGA